MPDHTVRGKMVRLRGVEANVREDGSVHISVTAGELPIIRGVAIVEQHALDLYRVLADVIEYGPGDGSGTTEGEAERGHA